MKRSMRTLSFCFLLVLGTGMGTSRAEDITAEKHPAAAVEAPRAGFKEIPEDLNADLNVSFYSQYIWRGYELSKDSLVIFPTATVGYKGFAVNLWADLDTRFAGSPTKEFKLQETDVTVSYSNSVAPLKLNYSLGWILYDYQPTVGEPDQTIKDTKNQELFLTLGLDTILKPILCIYDEIELGQAWYFMLGASHSFPLPKDISLDLALTASYLHNKSTKEFSNLHDGNVSAGLKVPLNKYLSVKPNFQYSFPLTNHARREIRDSSFSRDADFIYGGLIVDLAI